MPSNYLANDHDRLDVLFGKATADVKSIDADIYQEFRSGLMRHIGIEEKIVFPALVAAYGEIAKSMTIRLRSDHGAIVALLVPTPNVSVIANLSAILSTHNDFEEGANGVYSLLGALDGDVKASIRQQMEQAPEVPTHPTKPADEVIEVTKRAVARAGYVWLEE